MAPREQKSKRAKEQKRVSQHADIKLEITHDKSNASGRERRGLLVGGAVLGLGMVIGRGALAQNRLSIPYSNKSLDYYFFVIQEASVKRAVLARSGEFQATNANFDNTRQLEQWQSLLLSRPSAIISDPIDSQAIVSAIRRYNREKIPVGIIDTPADGGDVAITVSFDNFQGGVMAAEEIVNRLITRYGRPKGTVLNCYGALASVAWRLRKEGMDSVLPNIRASPIWLVLPMVSSKKCFRSPCPRCRNTPTLMLFMPLRIPPLAVSSLRCNRKAAGRR